MNQVVDEGSTIGKQLIAIYEGLGIELFDSNGQLRSSYDIFTDLAAIWPTLDRNTQNYIASVQAGTNQFQNFAALMQNFGHATEATEVALNSAGSAARENARYMESLQAKVAAVQASFQQLANTVIDSELVKAVLDIANALLQLGNTDLGKLVVQFGLLTGLLWGGSSLMSAMNILPAALSQFSTAIGLMTGKVTMAQVAMLAFKGTALEAAAASGTLSAGAKLLGVTLSTALPLAAAIAGVTVAIIALKQAYDAGHPSVEEMNTQLDENKQRLEEINNIPWNQRTDDIEAERQRLEAENEELEKNIDLRERRGKSIMQDIISNPEYKQQSYTARVKVGNTGRYRTFEADSLDELTQKMIKAGVVAKDFDGNFASLGITVQQTTKSFSNVIPSMDKNIDRYQELQDKIDSGIPLTAEENEEYVRLGKTIQNYVSDINDAIEAGETVAVTHRNMAKRGEEVTSSFDATNKKLAEQNNLLLQVAQGAVITEGNYQQLITLYPELIDYISKTNYGWELNVQALADAAAAGDTWAINLINDVINVAQEIDMLNAMFDRAFEQAESSGSPYASQMREANKQLQYLANLEKLQESAKQGLSIGGTGNSLYPGSGSGTSSGAGSSASQKDPIEAQSEAFAEQNDIIEHNIFLKEKQGATEEQLIDLYKDYQDKIHEQAEWYRSQGLDENSEYIRETQEQWWDLANTIADLEEQIIDRQRDAFDDRLQISEDYIDERKRLDDWGADSEIEAWTRVLEWMDEWYNQGLIDYEYYLEKRQEALENHSQAIKDAAQEQIDNIETAFNYIIDKAQDEIDKLNDRRQEIQDYYDEQIQALQDVNNELEDQIQYEEALDQLARARNTNVMVYKDGRFQYVSDIDAVSEAQANLEELERERLLNEEIKKLEEIRDKELAAIDDQIEYWEKYKEEWQGVVDQFTDEQDRLIAEMVFGTDLEQENWEKRLENLQSFVDQYLALLEQLEQPDIESVVAGGVSNVAGTVAGSIKDWISSLGGSGGSSSSSSKGGNTTATLPNGQKVNVSYNSSGKVTSNLPTGSVIHTAGGDYKITGGSSGNYTSTKVNKNATGTLSARGGFSLLGENGPELGVLQPGDGVIPADITKNLWSWGMTTPSSLLATIMGVGKLGQTVSIAIDTFAPELPNVTDGDSFANYMKNNFWRQVVQTQRT